MVQLLTSLEDYMFSLGNDVQRKELRLYAAFKRLKNFATVVLQRKNCLLLYLHVDPVPAPAVLSKARDVTDIGHSWGTGRAQIGYRTGYGDKSWLPALSKSTRINRTVCPAWS